ncbi:MAG: TlpA family protein disulfide reductase [Phycisphaerales bacterium JB039]
MHRTRPTACAVLVALAGFALAPAAVAQNDAAGGQPAEAQPAAPATPAQARLLEAQQVIKNAETLSYSVKSSVSMMLGGSLVIETDVDMMRAPDTRQWIVRREGKADVPQMGVTEFLLVNDGGYVTYVDHESKKVREEIARTRRKHRSMTLADSAWLETLAANDPYSEILSKAESFELAEGAERIDGVLCDKVTVSLGDQRGTHIWHLGADDSLPRRYEIQFNADMGRTYEIKNIRVGHALSDQIFQVPTPEGYEFVTTRRAAAPTTLGGFTGNGGGGNDGGATPTVTRRPKIMAPDFTLSSPDGKEVQLSGLRDRVVLLNFWASWSGASKSALDDIQAIHERYKDQPVTVLSLSWRERKAEAPAAEIKSRGHTYTLLTEADEVARSFQVKGFPTFIVVGKDGAIVETVAEFEPQTTRARLIEIIDKALAGEDETTTTTEGGDDNSPAAGNQGGNQGGGNQRGGNQGGGNQGGGNG